MMSNIKLFPSEEDSLWGGVAEQQVPESTKEEHKGVIFGNDQSLSNNKVHIVMGGERLQDITVHGNYDPDELITRITNCYLGSLKSVTDNKELDAIHRKIILQHPVLRNSLFRRLLEGRMQHQQYAIFFSEYLNASQRDFYLKTLPAALEAHDHASWKKYIEHIMHEESEPKQHHVLFEEFMESCGISRQEPSIPALEYARKMLIGYTTNLSFSAGYALGVEVEAGYEIAILLKALGHHFEKQLQATPWFDVHLGDEQEVDHARVSVKLVEDVIKSGGNLDAVRSGFLQFCNDVNEFMVDVNLKIDISTIKT